MVLVLLWYGDYKPRIPRSPRNHVFDRIKENAVGADLPVYLSANNLTPLIPNDLRLALKPVEYLPLNGGAIGHGMKAELLPEVLKVFRNAKSHQIAGGNTVPAPAVLRWTLRSSVSRRPTGYPL